MFVRLLHPDAKPPQRGTPGSAGYDLYALKDCVVDRDELPTKIRTGIALELPPPYRTVHGMVGVYARIADKSSLAAQGISVEGGVIDSDYREEVFVMLKNNSVKYSFEFKKGQKIAQLILEQICLPDVTVKSDLNSTERTGGFGSTGNF